MSVEIWKAIPGHEGSYEVSTLGRVKSLARKVPSKSRGTPCLRQVAERILRPGPSKSGHLSVILGREGGMRQVHELVLTTFVGPRPFGKESCHNDGNPANNKLKNLRWDTRRNNILDAIRKGSWWSKERLAHRDVLREIGRNNFYRINEEKRKKS